MYFSDLTHTLQNISTDEKAVFVSGKPGSGKTFAALEFCTKHKENLYFSFKNLDTAFALRAFCNAYTAIFDDSKSWFDFFECLCFNAVYVWLGCHCKSLDRSTVDRKMAGMCALPTISLYKLCPVSY